MKVSHAVAQEKALMFWLNLRDNASGFSVCIVFAEAQLFLL